MTAHDAILWVAVSLCLHALGTNLAWLARTGAGRSPAGAWLARVAAAAAKEPLALALRAAYLAGIPIAALATRVVTPAQMGLIIPASAGAVLRAIAFAVVTVALLLAARRRLAPNGADARADRTSVWAAGELLDTALRETHWAFLRGAILSVGSANPVASVGVAVSLAAIESWTDPVRRARMADVDGAAAYSVRGGAAMVSAYGFLATGSSVVAWVTQSAVVLACGWAAGTTRDHARDTAPSADNIEPTVI